MVQGLCNEVKIIVKGFIKHVLIVEIITKELPRKYVFILTINIKLTNT